MVWLLHFAVCHLERWIPLQRTEIDFSKVTGLKVIALRENNPTLATMKLSRTWGTRRPSRVSVLLSSGVEDFVYACYDAVDVLGRGLPVADADSHGAMATPGCSSEEGFA
jgi:hypothetical protein